MMIWLRLRSTACRLAGGVAKEDLDAINAAKPGAMEVKGGESGSEDEDLAMASVKAQSTGLG